MLGKNLNHLKIQFELLTNNCWLFAAAVSKVTGCSVQLLRCFSRQIGFARWVSNQLEFPVKFLIPWMFWGCKWRYLEATAHWPAPSWPESLCRETWHWAHEESARKCAGGAPAIKHWSTNWKSPSTPAKRREEFHYTNTLLTLLLPIASTTYWLHKTHSFCDLIIAIRRAAMSFLFKLSATNVFCARVSILTRSNTIFNEKTFQNFHVGWTTLIVMPKVRADLLKFLYNFFCMVAL